MKGGENKKVKFFAQCLVSQQKKKLCHLTLLFSLRIVIKLICCDWEQGLTILVTLHCNNKNSTFNLV